MIERTQAPLNNTRPIDLAKAITGHAILRISGGASAVLIGLYLARLSTPGIKIDASLVGMLGAFSFLAELLASIPFGMASDAIAPRWLMAGGAMAGAIAVLLFVLTPHVELFFLSRAIEGVAVAAVTPPLLAYLADATSHDSRLRARAMSFFEISLLAGLALGGVVATQFWTHLHLYAFFALAFVYLLCAVLLFVGARGGRSHGSKAALHGIRQALRDPAIRSLAPVWLAVNAVVGLWLGPTTTYLLTQRPATPQYLDGIYAATPTHVGWMLLGYSAVFGVGVFCWSFVLPRIPVRSAMRISLSAMPFVCLSLYALNHSSNWPDALRTFLLIFAALLIMIESGFTPAALSWLAQTLVGSDGKGAAMGIYSVLLGIGAIAGSLLAGWLGMALRFDGLLLATVALAIVALFLLRAVPLRSFHEKEESYEAI